MVPVASVVALVAAEELVEEAALGEGEVGEEGGEEGEDEEELHLFLFLYGGCFDLESSICVLLGDVLVKLERRVAV